MAETGVVEIQMPQMGESVTEGTILEWHKSEGEFVEEGETVVEVSTDKVDAEVPAPASGVLVKILAGEDDTVEVGSVLGRLDPDGAPSGNGASAETSSFVEGGGEGDADIGEESAPSESPQPGEVETAAPAATAEAGPSADPAAAGREAEEGSSTDPAAAGRKAEEAAGTLVIPMPEMGESVTEGTVLEWRVEEGQQVAEGDVVIEVSTDKIDAEVPAPAAGTITKLLVQPDDTVQVGQALAEMTAGAPPSGNGETPVASRQSPGAAAPAEAAPAAPVDGGDGANASPVARRVAAAKGVDLGAVRGTGVNGKITKEDVLAAADGNGAAPAAVAAGEAKPLRGPAGMLAQAMNESRQMPTATSFRTLPVDVLDAKRKAINAALKERGMKVSFTHLIAWAIARAATEWPVMVHTYTERDGKPQVVETEQVNLGIAVDVERKGGRSLLVPAIKGAESLDFAGFHSYYEELITKTRENKLTADDFQGTNISLTNPGGLGTVASVPRLMSGQGTIIATGSIAYPVEWAHAPQEKLKAVGVSKVMTMTSTYDHRIIQGAESGSFLRRIDQLLQGEDGFYEQVAEALRIPVQPVATAYAASASAPPLPAAT
ncbi:MAG: 2-oxo acid dehydrogenase subunit E2, partial [Solirubrobacterales bacterium]